MIGIHMSNTDIASANDNKRPGLMHRMTGSFRSEPEPLFVTETNTRTREYIQDPSYRLSLINRSGRYT